MSTWKYTKKITLNFKSVEDREAHENAYDSYQDWYYSQLEAGLADIMIPYVPYNLATDTVYEILVSDQAQADSFVAMVNTLGSRLGSPITGYSVTDVDYTSETLPIEFTNNVWWVLRNP